MASQYGLMRLSRLGRDDSALADRSGEQLGDLGILSNWVDIGVLEGPILQIKRPLKALAKERQRVVDSSHSGVEAGHVIGAESVASLVPRQARREVPCPPHGSLCRHLVARVEVSPHEVCREVIPRRPIDELSIPVVWVRPL